MQLLVPREIIAAAGLDGLSARQEIDRVRLPEKTNGMVALIAAVTRH